MCTNKHHFSQEAARLWDKIWIYLIIHLPLFCPLSPSFFWRESSFSLVATTASFVDDMMYDVFVTLEDDVILYFFRLLPSSIIILGHSSCQPILNRSSIYSSFYHLLEVGVGAMRPRCAWSVPEGRREFSSLCLLVILRTAAHHIFIRHSWPLATICLII